MLISDWSSDLCSSDLLERRRIEMALQVRGEGDARHRRTPRSESLPAAGDDCNCQQTDRVERRLSSQCLSLRDSQISVARPEIVIRSEGRRGGKECVRTFSTRWWPYNEKTK